MSLFQITNTMSVPIADAYTIRLDPVSKCIAFEPPTAMEQLFFFTDDRNRALFCLSKFCFDELCTNKFTEYGLTTDECRGMLLQILFKWKVTLSEFNTFFSSPDSVFLAGTKWWFVVLNGYKDND